MKHNIGFALGVIGSIVFVSVGTSVVYWLVFGPDHDINGIVRITDFSSDKCGFMAYTNEGAVVVPPTLWKQTVDDAVNGSSMVFMLASNSSWDTFSNDVCFTNHYPKLIKVLPISEIPNQQ